MARVASASQLDWAVRIEQVQNSQRMPTHQQHPANWGNMNVALQVLPLLCVPALAAQDVQVPKGLVGACRRRLTTLGDCVQANQANDHEGRSDKGQSQVQTLYDCMYESYCSSNKEVVFTIHNCCGCIRSAHQTVHKCCTRKDLCARCSPVKSSLPPQSVPATAIRRQRACEWL